MSEGELERHMMMPFCWFLCHALGYILTNVVGDLVKIKRMMNAE